MPTPAASPSPAPGQLLSTGGATAHYVGALLGPSLLFLPGLAAREAGPASLLAWLALLGLSGLIAAVFTRLGTLPGPASASGVAGYTAAGLGPRAGRAAAWCYLAGVVTGAPVVCLVGGAYVADALGLPGRTAPAALVLLALVLAMRLAGVRTGARLQLALVAALTTLVVVAVAGSAGAARSANWLPFAPHGWGATGTAASSVMFAFIGWEAAAPLTVRLRDPRRQLPRVVAVAFAVTSVLYLALAAATIGVLGPRAAGPVPLAELLRTAIGGGGPAVAAATAVLLTLAATNTYLTGAAAMAGTLLARGRAPAGAAARPARGLAVVGAVAAVGGFLLTLTGTGAVTTTQLLALPTALFLLVYLGCMAAAARVLTGALRAAALAVCVAVVCLLGYEGWATAAAVAAALLAGAVPVRGGAAAGAADSPVAAGAAGTPARDAGPLRTPGR